MTAIKQPLIVILMLCLLSVIVLYSAAGGSFTPWALKQSIRIAIGLCVMYFFMKTPLCFVYEWAYAWYAVGLFLLIGVELIGLVGMGAKRWLSLYIFHIQPSEVMRIGLIVALSRYFADARLRAQKDSIWVPLIMTLVPTLLVVKQPDLGTACLILGTSVMTAFIAGVRPWIFGAGFAGFLGALPVLWRFLHDYQKQRVLVFLFPSLDPQKAGYHITQSKIALGSGGFFGKGFLSGTQTHLNFLPEKQTDFVFTMFGEEFGLFGTVLLISAYLYLIVYGYQKAMMHKNYFTALCVAGLTSALFLYVFVNIAMVIGLLPVVGVPLPFVSYGGTALISLMISQGIIFSSAKGQGV